MVAVCSAGWRQQDWHLPASLLCTESLSAEAALLQWLNAPAANPCWRSRKGRLDIDLQYPEASRCLCSSDCYGQMATDNNFEIVTFLITKMSSLVHTQSWENWCFWAALAWCLPGVPSDQSLLVFVVCGLVLHSVCDCRACRQKQISKHMQSRESDHLKLRKILLVRGVLIVMQFSWEWSVRLTFLLAFKN